MHSVVISQDETDTVYDLTTVEAVNDALDLTSSTTNDAEIADQITSYSKQIGELCDRVFASRLVVETFMLHESWLHTLPLRHYPVSDISSVKVNDVALSASEYKVEPEGGQLWRWGASGCNGWPSGEIEVTYTAGYDLPSGAPQALAQACIEMIKDASFAGEGRGGDTSIREISHGDRRVSYFQTSVSASNASLTASVADLLRPFKRIPV